MPSRKPERRMASSRLAHSLWSRGFCACRSILPHCGKRSVRFQRDGSRRLRDPGVEIHFSASFFALFFANTGKFCTGEHQTGAFNHRAVDHLAVKGNDAETFAGGGFCGLNDQTRMGDLFTRRRIKVVQQFYLAGLISDLPSKPNCLMWAASCRKPASLLASE